MKGNSRPQAAWPGCLKPETKVWCDDITEAGEQYNRIVKKKHRANLMEWEHNMDLCDCHNMADGSASFQISSDLTKSGYCVDLYWGISIRPGGNKSAWQFFMRC